MRTHEEAMTLARYARCCIAEALGGPTAVAPSGDAYEQPGATFVSLHWTGGELQGCIGTLHPHRPLLEDVATNARAAAFRDPRARRLVLADVDALEVEVTILGPVEPVPCGDEMGACAALRPGTDGVVFAWGGRRATFIPQMWRHFDDARTLLAELKLKAGLPADFWAPDVEVSRYTAIVAIDRPVLASLTERTSVPS